MHPEKGPANSELALGPAPLLNETKRGGPSTFGSRLEDRDYKGETVSRGLTRRQDTLTEAVPRKVNKTAFASHGRLGIVTVLLGCRKYSAAMAALERPQPRLRAVHEVAST